jgi:hypothetical protein
MSSLAGDIEVVQLHDNRNIPAMGNRDVHWGVTHQVADQDNLRLHLDQGALEQTLERRREAGERSLQWTAAGDQQDVDPVAIRSFEPWERGRCGLPSGQDGDLMPGRCKAQGRLLGQSLHARDTERWIAVCDEQNPHGQRRCARSGRERARIWEMLENCAAVPSGSIS